MSENRKRLSAEVAKFIQIIDPKSWPAFIMFCVVLVAAGWLNYIAMSPIVGPFGAVVIAMFFGFGVLSWHIVESRTDDSEYQEDVAGIVKWTNAVLDGLLIVLNLFRAELRTEAFAGMNWADTLAFFIIGASAISHVAGYLIWTKNDPRRTLKKEGERELYQVSQKRQRSANAIESTKARAEALKYIVNQELEIREQYGPILPAWQVEELVRQMKINALKDFEGLQVAPPDVEKTQAVPPMRQTYAKDVPNPRTSVQSPNLPKNTGKQAAKNENVTNYTLDEFLQSVGMDKAEFKAFLMETDTFSKAWQVLREDGRLPSGITHKNFNELCGQVNPTPASGNGKHPTR